MLINYIAAYRKSGNELNLTKYHKYLAELRLKYKDDITIFEVTLAEKALKRGVTIP